MYQFVGTVKSFNGRYWRDKDVRVQASTLQYACKLAAQQAPREPRQRIEGITVTLYRVKQNGGTT